MAPSSRDGRDRSLSKPLLPITAEALQSGPLFELERPDGSAGFWSCVFNLANAAVGAGILAFPYAFQQAGWLLGALFASAGAALFCYTLTVIATASDRAFALAAQGKAVMNEGSYQELTAAVLGNVWGKVMTWMLAIYLTLSNVAFLNIMAAQARPVLVAKLGEGNEFTENKILVPLFAWCIGFPLSLLPNIKLFSIPSTLSQFGIFYTAAIIAYYGFAKYSANHSVDGYGSIETAKFNMNAVSAVPLICFSYQCHVTCPLVYDSMKGRSLPRMKLVSIVTILGCLLIYLVIGFGGYLMLGQQTPDDVLTGMCGGDGIYDLTAQCCQSNSTTKQHNQTTTTTPGLPQDGYEEWADDFGPSQTMMGQGHLEALAAGNGPKCSKDISVVVAIARFCVMIKVACSYGMLTFVTRNCIQSILLPAGKKFTFVQKLVVTFFYIALTMALAIVVPTLKMALSAAGVLVVVIDLIFPGFMMLKVAKSGPDRMKAYLCILMGTLVGIVSIVVTVKDA